MLEQRYHSVFGHDITVLGASRTDSGVHALEQVATFSTPFVLEPEKMMRVWNARLPSDIHIRSLMPVADEFYPLGNVASKTYYYHFSHKRQLPFFSRYVVHYNLPVDVEVMQQALSLFIGTHDFRSFCTGDEADSTIRTVDALDLVYLKRYGCYRITARGAGFLRYMIRRMVGAALCVSSFKGRSVDEIVRALAEKNPQQQLPTAPAHGLCLRKIVYK